MQQHSQLLQEIKKSVLSTDPNATVILYGSYARGDNRKDSDIDILVLLNKERITYDDRKRINAPLYHLELECGVMISPIIFAKATWDTRHKISPFYKNVTIEGRML